MKSVQIVKAWWHVKMNIAYTTCKTDEFYKQNLIQADLSKKNPNLSCSLLFSSGIQTTLQVRIATFRSSCSTKLTNSCSEAKIIKSHSQATINTCSTIRMMHCLQAMMNSYCKTAIMNKCSQAMMNNYWEAAIMNKCSQAMMNNYWEAAIMNKCSPDMMNSFWEALVMKNYSQAMMHSCIIVEISSCSVSVMSSYFAVLTSSCLTVMTSSCLAVMTSSCLVVMISSSCLAIMTSSCWAAVIISYYIAMLTSPIWRNSSQVASNTRKLNYLTTKITNTYQIYHHYQSVRYLSKTGKKSSLWWTTFYVPLVCTLCIEVFQVEKAGRTINVRLIYGKDINKDFIG